MSETRDDVFRELLRAHCDFLGLRVSEDEIERYWPRRREKAETDVRPLGRMQSMKQDWEMCSELRRLRMYLQDAASRARKDNEHLLERAERAEAALADEVAKKVVKGWGTTRWYECSTCGCTIDPMWTVCNCGRRLKGVLSRPSPKELSDIGGRALMAYAHMAESYSFEKANEWRGWEKTDDRVRDEYRKQATVVLAAVARYSSFLEDE